MHPPWTLSLYIARQFLLTILVTLLVLMAVAMLGDIVELLRRAAKREYVPFSVVLSMALLKAPELMQKLLPFAVLGGSMVALTRLTRTQELVVARASGVSVWGFLMPALVVVFLWGVATVTVFNPLSALMLLRFEKLESKYFLGQSSLITVSSSGLWLRQIEDKGRKDEVGEHIIHADRISQSDMTFSNVIIFSFDDKGVFTTRLDAQTARLEEGALILQNAIRSVPGLPPEPLESYSLKTTLHMAQIQESFASPETMPFWKLPEFIDSLEKAGFSALRHRLYWQSLLALPLLFMGTVLLAAVFSLRLPRQGGVSLLIAAGLLTGFALHFLTDVVQAFGAAGTIPIALAAWTPAVIMAAIASALLLQLEDG